MKQNKINIIFLGILISLGISCSKMNDLHQVYLDEGEVIYAAQVDSVMINPGNERAKLDLYIHSQRIETVRIFWNDYMDSVDVTINNQKGDFPEIIEGLDEKEYIFNLVSFDKFGNQSLPFEATGSVYGSNFQSKLTNRQVTKIETVSDNELKISWGSSVDYGIASELSYINNNEQEVALQIPFSESTSLIDNFMSDLKFRTLFIPEENAIDTFYTDWKPVDIE